MFEATDFETAGISGLREAANRAERIWIDEVRSDEGVGAGGDTQWLGMRSAALTYMRALSAEHPPQTCRAAFFASEAGHDLITLYAEGNTGSAELAALMRAGIEAAHRDSECEGPADEGRE